MKPKSISSLKNKAKVVSNAWIRRRDGRCVRCGKTKNLQCSHFWVDGRNSTRFNEENCDTLCYACHYGNLDGWEYQKQGEYMQFKIKQLGTKRYKALERLSNDYKKFTMDELEEIIERYHEDKI